MYFQIKSIIQSTENLTKEQIEENNSKIDNFKKKLINDYIKCTKTIKEKFLENFSSMDIRICLKCESIQCVMVSVY